MCLSHVFLPQLEKLFPNIDRAVIYQTYKACGDNEQMTAGLLMDNQADFMVNHQKTWLLAKFWLHLGYGG